MGTILRGDRADGTQQRLRYGLGEFKPYRWRGVPDWNPAKVLGKRTKRHDRECVKCGAQAGEQCVSQAGRAMRGVHTER